MIVPKRHLEDSRSMRKWNFLLVMPRMVQTVGEGYTFPIGIAYVSSSLKAAGYNVFTLNLNHIAGDIRDTLHQAIAEHDIDAVATGGYSSWFLSVQSVVASVKHIKKDVVTIVGGALVTAEPDIALEALECADYGVIGEGELTICELASCLEENADPTCVNGIIFKRNGVQHRTKTRDDISNLDALPWPDYEGFEFETYLATRGDSQVYTFSSYDKTAYVMGSRACPYRCTFCTQGITGTSYRQRSIAGVRKEIAHLKKRFGVNAVIMTDELFGRKVERVRKFAHDMADLSMPWEASFRVDCINTELIEILKNSTCSGLLVGVESADDRILKSMRKNITVLQIDEALRLAYDAEIMLDGNLIFGDIAETLETARTTLKWWRENAQYALALSMINPYPGTEIYKHACRKRIIPDPVRFLKEGGLQQVNVSGMNDEEAGLLTKEILETPYSYGPQVQNITNYRVDSNGVTSFDGSCYRCGSANSWQGIRLFTRSRILCDKCHQKHYAPILPQIKEILASRIGQLLEAQKRGPIAVWGVLDRSIDIMDTMPGLHAPGILFVDNAYWKQKIFLNGKKVYDPAVIAEQEVLTVVTFYVEMGSFQQVLTYTQKQCPTVKQVIRANLLLQGVEL